MAWGATIWHPDGRVQFDSTWPAMCRRQKGRATANATITVTGGRKPIVAIRPINCNAAIATASRSGNDYSYSLTIYSIGSGGYCDWWVYDTPPKTASNSGWAIVFWDEAGKVTFNSLYPPMRPVAEGPQPSGKLYAIVAAIGPKWEEQVITIEDTFGNIVGFDWATNVGGWEFDGSDFFTASYSTPAHFGLSSDQSYDPGQTSRLLIDVTGH